MSNNINTIQACIVKESRIFLKSDMSLDIVETKVIHNKLYSYISLINLLNSNSKFTVILSIEDKLLEELLNKFFEDGVEDDERDKLLDSLVDETINTVVGLAIKDFPIKYENLELGCPLKISKQNALQLLNDKDSQSLEIVTNSGSFICSVAYEMV